MRSSVAKGTVVGGYRIVSPLGDGAMGVVYLAESEHGERVALKLLAPDLARDERFRERFLRESRLASSFEHANVVRVLGAGEADGQLYLAMAYVEGSDLRTLLRREAKFEPARVVGLIAQVADALDAAHSRGLVHRDVKPGNILVTSEGVREHVYLCDFGLARHVSSVSSLTGERGFVGTIDYVPPEQIEGGSIDGRADVYSLGCVLYECLAGEKPFERDSELSVVFAHLNEPPPRITEVRPQLPAAFDEVFATTLAKDPGDRYSSCGELAAAARAALRGKVRRPRRRRRLIAAAVAVVVVAGAAVGAVLATSSGGEHSVVVPITQTAIGGARLGDSDILLEQMWDGGQKLSMQFPPNYSVLRQNNLDLSAYFSGASEKAVQLTTWNAAARTAEGVGPCSTLAELRKAYGTALKPAPHSTHGNTVWAYLLPPHLLFAMMGKPVPDRVQSVGLYGNPEEYAGFNALNDGPCTGSAPAPAPRPKTLPRITAPPPLVRTLSLRRFTPRVTVRVPAGWRLADGGAALTAPSGASMRFVLDPHASTAAGKPRDDVSATPAGLAAWLRTQTPLEASARASKLVGKPPLSLSVVDLSPQTSVPYLAFSRAPALRTRAGKPSRLWLTAVRYDAYAHTFAIVLDAPSQKALLAIAPAADAVVGSIRIAAAPVAGLSALSTQCTKIFGGTCLGELTAGSHHTTTFRPALTYTVPVGWTNFQDQRGSVSFVPPGGDWQAVDPEQSDYVGVFTSIRGNPNCDGKPVGVTTPDAFVRMLDHDPRVRVLRASPAAIGGLHGYVLTMRDAGRTPCPWSQGQAAAPVIGGLPPTTTNLAHEVPPPPGYMRLYVLGYKSGTLGIEVDEIKGSSKLSDYSRVVRSFRFAAR